jgi:AraC family transcriptional regulator
MFQPESDWTGQERFGVERFAIDRRVETADTAVDIRRFKWVAPSSGVFSPARHYLDYSLTPQTRRSLLKAEAWPEARYSGDILYLPPGHAYWGKPAMQERRLLCLALGDRFLADVFEDDRRLDSLMPCADVQSGSLRRLLEALAAELMAPGFASDTLVDAMLTGVAVELVRHLRGEYPSRSDASRANSRQLRTITDYVMDHLSTTINIADIARECGMSTRHVARSFRDATGISLGDYVARSRIAFAKELLASAQVQIKEISGRCGFSSTSAFSASFRKATGSTPKEFRQGTARLQ